MSQSSTRPISFSKLIVPAITFLISAVVLVIGVQLTTSGVGELNAALESQQATPLDVYGGQSEIGVASAILVSGIIGLIISLATFGLLIGLGGLRKDPEVDAVIVEEFDEDFSDDAFDGLQAPVAPVAPVAPATAAESPYAESAPVEAAVPAEAPAEAAPVEPKNEGERPAN